MSLQPTQNLLPGTDLTSLEEVRSSLSKSWLIAGLVLFAVVIAQSISGHYGDEPRPAWTWLLGAIMPTIGVIVGALCYTALNPHRLQYVVRRFFYRIALALSIVYLLLIAVTIAIEPFVPMDAFELMQVSNNWLIPIQTLTASVIGVLFFKAKPPVNGALEGVD